VILTTEYFEADLHEKAECDTKEEHGENHPEIFVCKALFLCIPRPI